MRVFISSVIRGFEEMRSAARQGIETLGHDVIEAEDFAASPQSPQCACLQEARDADAVVLLLGAAYGTPQRSKLSATHEEYLAVRENDKVLVFVQSGIEREPTAARFLADVRGWEQGHLTEGFRTPNELTRCVVRALHRFEVERATGVVDEAPLLARADEALKVEPKGSGSELVVAVAAGPTQALVRPAQLESRELAQRLAQELLFGADPLFEVAGWDNPQVVHERLVLAHKRGGLSVDGAGTVVVRQPAEPVWIKSGMRPILEEDVRDKIGRALRIAGRVLNAIDPTEYATAILPVVTLTNPNNWTTRSEYDANPNRLMVSRLFDYRPLHVQLTPAAVRRAVLLADASRLAEDFTALLRRQIKSSGFPPR